MKNEECVQKYITDFVAVSEKLEEIGIKLQEELLVIMLLASLPKSYENFVVALETRDELPKMNLVKIKLIEESQRRKDQGDIGEGDSTVKIFSARNEIRNSKYLKNKKNV